jgi:hypothetical protein
MPRADEFQGAWIPPVPLQAHRVSNRLLDLDPALVSGSLDQALNHPGHVVQVGVAVADKQQAHGHVARFLWMSTPGNCLLNVLMSGAK